MSNSLNMDPEEEKPWCEHPSNLKTDYDDILMCDLERIGNIGAGNFGRVDLVEFSKDRNQKFALKCLKKCEVVESENQECVFRERDLMARCDSPFICKFYRTFKDNKYIYFLMEPLFGGDLWTSLQRVGYFDDQAAKFLVACVVEAFEHLHSLNIVFRDLKPENAMLDHRGYLKLIDFGCAKLLEGNERTYSFCVELYGAPEIIKCSGHDKSTDYWALGVLVYELTAGVNPFIRSTNEEIHQAVVEGMDVVEFDSKISETACDLIRKLCRYEPEERLGNLDNGIQDIKEHEWFLDLDWGSLKSQELEPPFVPEIVELNCDFPVCGSAPEETSGWDDDF